MQPTSTSLSSRGPRAGSVLRALQLLALAVLAFFVVGNAPGTETSTGPALAALTSVVEATSSVQAELIRSGSHAFNDRSSRDDTPFDALEADLDDDDIDGDHRFAALPSHPIAPPDARPTAMHRSARVEPQRDPSWFAIGHGFARGPPVSIVRG